MRQAEQAVSADPEQEGMRLAERIMTKDEMIGWLVETIDTEVDKPENKADMDLIQACSELLMVLNGTDFQLSEEELQERCRKIMHNGKKKHFPCAAWKKGIAAACAVVMIFGCGVTVDAFFPSLLDKIVLLVSSSNGYIELDGIKYTHLGEGRQYSTIEEMFHTEGLNLHYPYVDLIDEVINLSEEKRLIIKFKDPTIGFVIKAGEYSSITNPDYSFEVNNFTYLIDENDECDIYVACMVLEGNTYSISCKTKDMLFYILENMR